MNSGRYKYPATVYQPAVEKVRTTRERKALFDVWVSMEPTSAGESTRGEGIETSNAFTLRCPWFPCDWNTAWYIELWDGRRLSIDGVINKDETNHEWQITATQEART